MRRLTTEEFIEKAKEIHGDKYSYTKSEYVKSNVKVCITCNSCGYVFWQTPNDHLNGKGCPSCSHKLPLNRERFVELAIQTHGNKYSYERTICDGWKKKVIITCPIHGDFLQSPSNHISNKHGCPQCAKETNDDLKRLNSEEVIDRFKKIKGEVFDYSKVDYINMTTKVCITCRKHGDFWIYPMQFIKGIYGCPLCWEENRWRIAKRMSKEDFVRISNNVHNNKYGYNEVKLMRISDKVKIYCPEHGYFYQVADSHLRGFGCRKCRYFSNGEKRVESFLAKIGILSISQYRICNTTESCSNKHMYIDFYIPSKKIAIEYNGAQHYKPVEWWGGQEKFLEQQERDKAVRQYCKDHNIKLIEIPYTEFNNIEEILTKELNIAKKSCE